MQIDSDAEEETQTRGEGEKGDRAKDNNQVSVLFSSSSLSIVHNIDLT